MDDDDKPFVCNAPGCGQKFTNSDHLNVHRQKHQLSLNIGRQGESIVDQTPTPTRFLPKTAEDGGDIFGVLPDANPFEQDFKKAALAPKPGPLPVISVSPPETIERSQNSRPTLIQNKALDKIRIPNNNNKSSIKIVDGNSGKTKNIFGDGTNSVTIVVNTQQNAISGSSFSSKANPKGAATVLISTQNNIAPIIVKPNPEGKLQGMPIIGLKPGGQKDSVRSAVPTPAIVAPRGHQNGAIDASKSSLTKQKLKEVIQQNAVNSRASVLTNQNTSQTFVASSGSIPSPSNSIVSDTSDKMLDDMDDEFKSGPIKRSRRSQEDLDPEERRRKFLERNRAAASRCRQKRKVWVQQLEKKADDLSTTNVSLQNEINVLKSEVAQLKALLLAHKDCPITMQQQQKTLIKHSNGGFSEQAEGHILNFSTIIKPRFETAEEVASSALTDMANQSHATEPPHPTVSVISAANSTSSIDTVVFSD